LTCVVPSGVIEINDIMESRMAGNLHVRNLDDDLIARLKRCATRHGRSTEAEHREILRQALVGNVEPSFDTLAADLRADKTPETDALGSSPS
jgi:plasmid stability protein